MANLLFLSPLLQILGNPVSLPQQAQHFYYQWLPWTLNDQLVLTPPYHAVQTIALFLFLVHNLYFSKETASFYCTMMRSETSMHKVCRPVKLKKRLLGRNFFWIKMIVSDDISTELVQRIDQFDDGHVNVKF